MTACIVKTQDLNSSGLDWFTVFVKNASGDSAERDHAQCDLAKLLSTRQGDGGPFARRRERAKDLPRKSASLHPQSVRPWRQLKAETAFNVSIFTNRGRSYDS